MSEDIKKSKVRTFGESYTLRSMSMFMQNGKWKRMDLPPHLDRMNYENAAKYYKEKIYKVMNWKRPPSRFEIIFDDILAKVLRDRDRLVAREVCKNRKLLLKML